jgi:16S rRNA (cytosine967-C5)-methyltransferase
VRTHLIKLACDVIRNSTTERPTDRVLAEALRADKDLTPEDRREASRAVFTYYRWLGWLRNESSTRMRLFRAEKLNERFQAAPLSLPADHLRAKAVQGWLAKEMRISDDWLRSLQREPRLWLRARPGQAKALAKKLNRAKATGTGDAVLYEGEKDLFLTDEFRAGEFEIQDIASQLVGLACAPKSGDTWWDACAGEGGKTLHLCDLMQGKGLVWATDRAEWRLDRLKRRAARAKVFNYRSEVWDGGPALPTKTKFDGVLLDAPCTGIGTWGRNPHARWTLRPADIAELAEVQKRLLTTVATAVKPGGKLVYAVCTLTTRDTQGVVEAFETAQPGFEPLPLHDPLSPDLPPRHPLTLWPQRTHGNGMFIAAWRRKAG